MNNLDLQAGGREMHALAGELYPLCRSITGDGVRSTLQRLAQDIPLTVREVPSGTQVFDWTVPEEWNIREAWIKDPHGRVVVSFANQNLHVVGYSTPVRGKMPLSELKLRLFSLPDQPDLIPYRTSYYKKSWGFCLPHRDLERLEDGEYEVCIDSNLRNGSLTYGECFISGATDEEVLVSCHTCHPSLANDNLAGIAVAVALARQLASCPQRLSYRFLFIPGTIGSIAWLALNEAGIHRIQHGLVLTCAGDAGPITYKKSRRGNAIIDRAMQHVLRTSGAEHRVVDFHPYGYDERQYCSPGINLPVG
jgi:aminopeptidase-like protein